MLSKEITPEILCYQRVCDNHCQKSNVSSRTRLDKADIITCLQVHRIYRSTGASFAKAQQEFTSEIMRNQHVRDAAGNVVSAAVQNQFNQPRSPSSRY